MARGWCQLGGGNDLRELMSLSCQSDSDRVADRICEGTSGGSRSAVLIRVCGRGKEKGVTQALCNKFLFLGGEVLTVCQGSSS